MNQKFETNSSDGDANWIDSVKAAAIQLVSEAGPVFGSKTPGYLLHRGDSRWQKHIRSSIALTAEAK